jgi:hypothetical protein
MVLNYEEYNLCAKQLFSIEWKKHCFSWKKTINFRRRRVSDIVFL